MNHYDRDEPTDRPLLLPDYRLTLAPSPPCVRLRSPDLVLTVLRHNTPVKPRSSEGASSLPSCLPTAKSF